MRSLSVFPVFSPTGLTSLQICICDLLPPLQLCPCLTDVTLCRVQSLCRGLSPLGFSSPFLWLQAFSPGPMIWAQLSHPQPSRCLWSSRPLSPVLYLISARLPSLPTSVCEPGKGCSQFSSVLVMSLTQGKALHWVPVWHPSGLLIIPYSRTRFSGSIKSQHKYKPQILNRKKPYQLWVVTSPQAISSL